MDAPPRPAAPGVPSGGHSELGTAVRGTPPLRPIDPAGNGATVVAEIERRSARLEHWSELARPLRVAIPSLPVWAREMARAEPEPEPWLEVMRGVERLAQKRLLGALEEWEKQTRIRLSRLEAYSVDSRLEREQIDDVLNAARLADFARALATYQQVERVVALKERHLDQAREELERMVALVRDMQTLGFQTSADPDDLAEELERELRGGRLAALKQQLRSMRQKALDYLKVAFPERVARYGESLAAERQVGAPVDAEVAELAQSAREFARGRPDEALRRMRLFVQMPGVVTSNPAVAPTPPRTDRA